MAHCQYENSIQLLAFENVSNIRVALDKLAVMDNCVLVDLSFVLNEFHLKSVALKCFLNKSHSKLKTRSLVSEFFYQISPSTNVNEQHNPYKCTESTSMVALVFLECNDIFTSFDTTFIDGTPFDISELESARMDTSEKRAAIAKMFKVSTIEFEASSLYDAVVTRVAIKDYV
jgi:hypothetical protein